MTASGLAASAAPELMLYDPRLLSAPGPFQTARLAWVTEVRGTGNGDRHRPSGSSSTPRPAASR